MPEQEERFTLSYMTLRQATGWAGLLMPLSVRVGGYLIDGILTTDSISAYYYTGMRDLFVTTLVLVGTLLACYRTPARQDTWVGVIAGASAIGIAWFPTDPVFAKEILAEHPDASSPNCYLGGGILGYHFLFVGTFFALAFYLVYFRFSAFTPANPTPEKVRRNRIYRLCGLVMLASFAAIGLMAMMNKGGSIFWPEAAAVGAFAIAWLVKGQFFLKDRC